MSYQRRLEDYWFIIFIEYLREKFETEFERLWGPYGGGFMAKKNQRRKISHIL
jgi:hypothetical protein